MDKRRKVLLGTLIGIAVIVIIVTLSVTLTSKKEGTTVATITSSSLNSGNINNVTSIYFSNVSTRSYSIDFSTTTKLPDWLMIDNSVVGSNGSYRRQYSSQNILFQNGKMVLRVPGGQQMPSAANNWKPVLSAQILSVLTFQYGHVRMVAKLSALSGTCQSLFFYKSDYNEIDIEIIFPINASSPQLWLTVQPLGIGKPTYHVQAQLPSSATTSFIEYGIVWTSTRVYFLVDAVIIASVLTGVPTLAAKVYISNWADSDPFGWPNGNNTPLPSTNSDLIVQSLSIVSPL